MSCSPAQLEANRVNAQSSTGPVSDGGKAKSSLNALKHGFFSQGAVIEGEDPAEFRALHEQYASDLFPRNTVERELVERIVVSVWKRNRILKIERQFWASDQTFAPFPGNHLMRLNTYEVRLNNTVDRCLRQLRSAQKVSEEVKPADWMDVQSLVGSTPNVRNEAKSVRSTVVNIPNEAKLPAMAAVQVPVFREITREERAEDDRNVRRIGAQLKMSNPDALQPGNMRNEPKSAKSASPEPIFEPMDGPSKSTQDAVAALLRQQKEQAKKNK